MTPRSLPGVAKTFTATCTRIRRAFSMTRTVALVMSLLLLVVGLASAAEEPIRVTSSFTYAYDRTNWATCVSFKNLTDKTIVAVQFKFTYVDAFDTTIQTNRGDRVGEFAPGVLIEGATSPGQLPGPGIGGGNIQQHSENCWEVLIVAGSLSKITTEVQKVRYADGTIWVNPGLPTVFTAQYMASGPYTIDAWPHPKNVPCGIVNWPWESSAKAQIARGNSGIIKCYNKWLAKNGYGPYVPGTAPIMLATPSPAPTPQ